MIYFLSAIGRMKIGFSTNVEQRAGYIQTGIPEPVFVLASVEGDRALEGEIHAALSEYNISGEWFEDCEIVRRAIKSVIDGTFSRQSASLPANEANRVHALLLRARAIWPRRTALAISNVTGRPERTCYDWLAGTCGMPGSEALALLEAIESLEPLHSTKQVSNWS